MRNNNQRHTGNPVNDNYQRIRIQDSGDPGYINRLLIGTPTTGTVRIEWHCAIVGQIIPTNWSKVDMFQWMNGYFPVRYQVADAQNLIVKEVIEKRFEWLILLEHDNIIPPDCFMRFNKYIREKSHPVVSGLYYTRSSPAEPIIYRGRGSSYFNDWYEGDLIYCDGVPTGCLLIHAGILRAMWEESEPYTLGEAPNQITTRRVFRQPNDLYIDPETGQYNLITGTSDLDWCTRVMEEGFLEKAGWAQFQGMRWPFLVDTNIFVHHIDPDGTMFPKPEERALHIKKKEIQNVSTR